MTDQAEAQAALDAVRAAMHSAYGGPPPPWKRAVLAALENLDARLKALEGK